jgi:hypothetical protein
MDANVCRIRAVIDAEAVVSRALDVRIVAHHGVEAAVQPRGFSNEAAILPEIPATSMETASASAAGQQGVAWKAEEGGRED